MSDNQANPLAGLTNEELLRMLSDELRVTVDGLQSGAEIRRRLADRDELQATFDLRWSADMRAIKKWQDAHPGKELVWPDHADLRMWLMERLEKCERIVKGCDKCKLKLGE